MKASAFNLSHCSDRSIGYFCAAIGLSLFAMKGIVIKLAYEYELDAVVTLTWRMIFALPFYVLIGLWLWRARSAQQRAEVLKPRTFSAVLFCGVMSYYVSSYLDFKGLEYVSAQFERLTLYTYPFFVLLFSVLLIGARVSVVAVLALCLSYAGIALMFVHDMPQGEEQNYALGTVYVMGAAITFAFQQVLSKPFITKVGSRLYTSIAMVAASIAVFVHFALTNQIAALAVPMQAIWLMLLLAVFCTVIPTYLMNEAVRRIGPQHTSSMGGVGPIITIVAAIIVLDEGFTAWHAAGTALVLAGVGLFSKHKA